MLGIIHFLRAHGGEGGWSVERVDLRIGGEGEGVEWRHDNYVRSQISSGQRAVRRPLIGSLSAPIFSKNWITAALFFTFTLDSQF